MYLCTVLMRNPNFLVLDEPTNDLDIVTLNVLEEYLANFKGCVMVVSHDRYFMDKVVDHLTVFQGNAKLKDFPGNYSDYREWKEIKEWEEKEKQKNTNQRQPQSPKEEAKKPIEAPKPIEEKKKLSFKEKREFEEIEKQLPQLENEKTALETELNTGNLSTDKLIAKSKRVSEIIQLIDEKTMRWLELSECI